MRSKAIFMALLAFAFGAQAEPVSSETVKAAARAWVQRGHGPFRSLAGVTVEEVTEFRTTDDVPFFAAKIAGGGTVFLSGDTAISPIIAFTPASTDFSSIDPKSPLWALLNRDISVRARALKSEGPYLFAANQVSRASVNRREWAELEAEGADASPYVVNGGVSYGVAYESEQKDEPEDIRVPMLMKSQWSQGNVGLSPCYNYFTPNNYVCGCVATALGQFLLYNHGPEGVGRGIPQKPVPENEITRTIAVDGDDNQRKETIVGGVYAWDDMPPAPATVALTDQQRRNIGRLLSDLGIALNMSYSSGGSGAYTLNQSHVLVDYFGYRQSLWMNLGEGAITAEGNDTLRNAMFANFDAGSPVLMSIPEHAIVADGYGFEGETPYVHLNFGWAGQSDMWYNLPDMTAAGEKYAVVDGINFNAFADAGGIDYESGMTKAAVLSGRVLDDDGLPVEDCAVTITRSADRSLVTNLVSDARGVWSVILEGEGTYDIRAATDDGEWIGGEEGVLVSPPTSTVSDFPQSIGGGTDKLVSASDTGNSWGHDLVLAHPSVRVGTDIFSSLDQAIVAARAASATAEEPVRIEILDVARFKNPAEIDFDCVLVATNDDPYASAIVRPYEDTFLIVTNGATLALSNVVFAESTEVPVEVRKGGQVSVAGTVDFGITYDQTALVTADADGFVLSGPIDPGFTLDCAVAQTEGLYFGFADCDFATASEFAARIVCANDKLGELRGEAVEAGGVIRLRWVDDATRVPLADAVGYYVDAADGTNTRARIDRLFAKFEEALADGTVGAARELVILRPGALTRPLTVGGDVTIRGEDNPVVDCSAMSGFTVTNGTLTVSGITFSGYENANGLFLVEGGKLVLDGVGILDAKGTKADSGAVVVRDGAEAELIGGTVLAGCSASGSKLSVSKRKGYGGGVTVDAGASLTLGDCMITNCWALNNGGGVFAAEGSRVVLTNGVVVVRDNTSGSSTSLKADDLYVAGTNGTEIGTVGQPGEGSAVGVRYGVTGGVGNREGDVFARILTEVSDTNLCAEAFFNDTSDGLSAVAAAADLKWQDRPTQVGSSTDGSGMRVAVFNVEDGKTLYYRHVEPAFAEVTGDSIVLLRTNDTFDADIEVKYNVVLTTDKAFVPRAGIERAANCSIVVREGGSLTVDAAGIYGCPIDAETEELLLETNTVPLIKVDGGSLTLDADSEVAFALGDGSISANAVTVNGGTFTMKDGAAIYCCGNFHDRSSVECGFGGGLYVQSGTAHLEGGEIADCFAAVGGGAFIGSGSKVYVSGNVCITNNTTLDTAVTNNLVVSDVSGVILADVFTGAIGYNEGVRGDTKVFGRVGEDFSGTPADMQASAHRFTHDVTGDVGMAVSNGSETLLVWGSALDGDGRYADDYELVEGDPYELPADPAAESFTYDGTEKTAIIDGIGYRVVSGNTGVDAGEYEAILTNRPGFVWADGTTGEKTLLWSIGKATYDLSGISFEDREFPYDGYEHSLKIEGTLPEELAVTYSGNNLLRQPGTNEVMATITVAVPSANWMLVPDPTNLTAKLIVLPASGSDPQPPQPEEPAQPLPIAFKSITGDLSAGTWTMVVTQVVEKCWYSLYETNSLVGGFKIEGVEPVWTKQPEGGEFPEWTITRPNDGTQLFWRMVAEPEDAH